MVLEIVDLGSQRAGCDRDRVNIQLLHVGDIVSIGRRYFRFTDEQALEEYVDQAEWRSRLTASPCACRTPSPSR